MDAAYKYFTLSGDSITKDNLSNIAKGDKITKRLSNKVNNTSGIETGKNILESLRSSFKEDTLKGRMIPDWIISKFTEYSDITKAEFADNMSNFFKTLDRTKVDLIETAKGKRGDTTKEDVVFELLNKYYSEFKEEESIKQTA